MTIKNAAMTGVPPPRRGRLPPGSPGAAWDRSSRHREGAVRGQDGGEHRLPVDFDTVIRDPRHS